LSEGSFVRNGVVQIPKYDANPSPGNPNPVSIHFGQTTLRTSDLSPFQCYDELHLVTTLHLLKV